MLRWLGLGARLVVGGVWLYAGLLKLPHPAASVSAVRGYQLLPTRTTEIVGHAVPMLEAVVGACLLVGLLVLSLLLVWPPRTPLALDNVLFRPLPPLPSAEPDRLAGPPRSSGVGDVPANS